MNENHDNYEEQLSDLLKLAKNATSEHLAVAIKLLRQLLETEDF